MNRDKQILSHIRRDQEVIAKVLSDMGHPAASIARDLSSQLIVMETMQDAPARGSEDDGACRGLVLANARCHVELYRGKIFAEDETLHN